MKTLSQFILLIPFLTFAQTPTIDQTNFFVELKYGIHIPTNGYSFRSGLNSCDRKTPDLVHTKEYNEAVKRFIDNLDDFVEQVVVSGAKYIVLNLGQSDGKYCSPNKTYQKLMFGDKNKKGYLTSSDDLPLALLDKLQNTDIKLFLYFNLDGPSKLRAWRYRSQDPNVLEEYFVAEGEDNFGLGYNYQRCLLTDSAEDCNEHVIDNVPKGRCDELGINSADEVYYGIERIDNHLNQVIITQDHVDNIIIMLKEWSDRYGDKIAGWVFDHAYSGTPYYNKISGFTPEWLKDIKNAVINGSISDSPSNPNAIVSFNKGAINNSSLGLENAKDYTPHQHFTFGEISPNYNGNCKEFNQFIDTGFPLNDDETTTGNPNDIKSIWKQDVAILGENIFKGRKVHSSETSENFSQFHNIITMGDRWGCHNVNVYKKANSFNSYLYDTIKENGVTTISIGNILKTDGDISNDQMDGLNLINSYVRTNNCNYLQNSSTLENMKSGLYIEAPSNNQDIVTQEYDGEIDWIIEDIDYTGTLSQLDEIPNIDPSPNSIRLVRIFNTDTHKYLAIQGGQSAVGTKIIQTYWNDWGTQKWILVKLTDGKYAIRSFQHDNRYITVKSGSLTPEVLQINGWNTWTSQKWIVGSNNPMNRQRITDLDQTNTLSVFPNPTKSKIEIKLNGGSSEFITSIKLMNFNGSILNEIKKSRKNNYNLDLDSLSDGMYLLKIETNKRTYIKKVIKQS